MDIQQGNIVTSKMLMQLKPGMSKSQARFVMGTPLLQDSFHGDRWDYFYQYRKDGKIVQQRRVILEFENEALKRVRGDTIAAGVDPTVPELQRRSNEPEKGLWDRIKFWKSDEAPVAAPAAAVAGAAAVDTPSSNDALDPMLVNPAPSSPARPSDVSDPAEPVAPAAVAREPVAPVADKPVAPAKPAPVQSAPAKPAAAASSQAAPAAKAAPAKAAPAPAPAAAEEELPAEEDPGYFERMLEKIGF